MGTISAFIIPRREIIRGTRRRVVSHIDSTSNARPQSITRGVVTLDAISERKSIKKRSAGPFIERGSNCFPFEEITDFVDRNYWIVVGSDTSLHLITLILACYEYAQVKRSQVDIVAKIRHTLYLLPLNAWSCKFAWRVVKSVRNYLLISSIRTSHRLPSHFTFPHLHTLVMLFAALSLFACVRISYQPQYKRRRANEPL